MSDIGKELLKKLQEMTNAGIEECKKALDYTKGNMEKAADLLKEESGWLKDEIMEKTKELTEKSKDLAKKIQETAHVGMNEAKEVFEHVKENIEEDAKWLKEKGLEKAAAAGKDLVRQLRDMTSAGIMDCKKALEETKGNIDEAITWLRKKGISKAASKASRVASDGLIAVKVDGKTGTIIELNSETDFVAKNERFQHLCVEILDLASENHGDKEKTLEAKIGASNLQEKIQETIAVIGENLSFRRAKSLTIDRGIIGSYIHNNIAPNLGKIGVLISIESDAKEEDLKQITKQLSMHIAASSPQSLDISDLDPDLVAKEKDIAAETSRNSGKPENVIEKMIEGRLRKYFEEVVLLEQIFIVDGKSKIKDWLKEKSDQLKTPVKIKEFVCYKVGEGIEKEVTNFAEEVASMMKK